MISSPSYLSKNRCGIFYFQYRVPTRFIQGTNSRKLIRVSLHTREQREAIKFARYWSFFVDKLETHQQDSNGFLESIELLIDFKRHHSKVDLNLLESFVRGLVGDDHKTFTPIPQGSSSTKNQSNTDVRVESPKQTTFSGPQLSEAIKQYVDEISSQWDQRHKKVNGIDLIPKLDLFLEVVGDKPLDRLTVEDVTQFKNVVSKFPSNKNKKVHYRDLSAKAFLSARVPEDEKLSATSISKYYQRISSFLKWAKLNSSHIDQELWHPLDKRPKHLIPDDEQRQEFDDDDVRRLLLSTQYTSGTHKCPSHYWVPLLAVFTGARANELCQLHKTDVYPDLDSGIWVLDINQNTYDKKLKRPHHKRLIPIHSTLQKLGFIEFVKQSHTLRLFEELTLRTNGYADGFSKWFNRSYRSEKQCNVGNGSNERKNFHSFRHTVINQLEKRGIPQPQIARLVGQQPSDGTVTSIRYGKKNSVEENLKIIEQLSYSVEFKKIKKWRGSHDQI